MVTLSDVRDVHDNSFSNVLDDDIPADVGEQKQEESKKSSPPQTGPRGWDTMIDTKIKRLKYKYK
jgi:hypothetical protein